MQPLLIILLLLSVLTNVLLILLLLRSGQQNTAEDQTDEIARIVRDEVEAETEVLADQLRVMQGEVTRTTSASARDMGTLLAESQRQSQEAATARLDAIDRAGAARQRAANDALLAQLQVLETRLKNLEDTNANRLDGVRATLLQGMANIRADNNKKLDEIRGTVDEKLEATLQRRVSESFRAVSTQLEQVYKGLGEMQNLAADVGSLKQVLSGFRLPPREEIHFRRMFRAIVHGFASQEDEGFFSHYPASTELSFEFAIQRFIDCVLEAEKRNPS